MRSISFLEGVVVALAASVVGSSAFFGLSWLVVDDFALRLVILGLAFAYLLYLFSRSREKTGRMSIMVAWLVVSLVIGLWQPSITGLLLVQVGILWLIRSLYFHNGLLTALADLGLNAFALAAAFWALQQSGSIGLMLWCFFLAQSLFVFLIGNKPEATADNSGLSTGADDFQHAYQTAQAAVRKLSSTKI